MGWLIRKLIKLIMLLILIGIIGGIVYIFVVSPNKFKPQITKALQTYTGQPFVINGSIEWTLRPRMNLVLHDVVLGKSADDKTPAIQIKEADMSFDILSLIKNNATISDITLNNVVIDWALTKALTANTKNVGHPLLVENFQLKNGSIALKDPTEHLNWQLQNFTANASNLMINAGQEIPAIQIQGDLLNLDNNTKYTIDTNLKFDLNKHALNLDPLKMTWNDTPIEGTASIANLDTEPVISGNMAMNPTDVGALLKKMDPYFANSSMKVAHTMQMQTDYLYTPKDQILDLTKFHLQVDKGMMSGDVKLGFASPFHAEFNLSANNIDFSPIGLLGSAMFPAIHTMNSIPVELIKNVVVAGKFSGTQLTINNELAIDQLHMEISGQGGVVQIMPVIINAYGGTHNAALHLDVTSNLPTIQFTEQADKVDLEPWLKLMQETNIISGTASVKASLQATGTDVATLKQSLTGGINLYVNKGTLQGINANKLMQFATQTTTDIFNELSSSPAANMNVLAIKRSSDWIKTQQDNPKTAFEHLEFTADFAQGVSQKTNLAMTTDVIDLKGAGSYALSDQSVNFSTTMVDLVDVTAESKVLAGYIKQTPLAMTITGTLNKPVYGPNVQTYVLSVLKASREDLLNQAVSKMVSVTPPNAKTDKSASDLFINSLQSLNK